MRAEESRPAGNRAAIEGISPDAPSLADVPGLDTMTDRAQHIAMEYWRSGYTYGWEAGFAAAEAAQAELDRRAAAAVSTVARGTDYATLCERRGEPERAERQRRILAERGIA